MLGLLFSDEGWYQYSYEQPMFHLQHFLMVAAPWYYIYIDRYDFSKVLSLDGFFPFHLSVS